MSLFSYVCIDSVHMTIHTSPIIFYSHINKAILLRVYKLCSHEHIYLSYSLLCRDLQGQFSTYKYVFVLRVYRSFSYENTHLSYSLLRHGWKGEFPRTNRFILLQGGEDS